jgi:hypothetical protein
VLNTRLAQFANLVELQFFIVFSSSRKYSSSKSATAANAGKLCLSLEKLIMKDNLTIKALKYISKRNGEYKPVDIKEFLLANFIDKPDFIDRAEIRSFLDFLTKSELIKTISTNGLFFVVEAGRKISREEISAIVKITSKGFDLIRENDKHIKNSISFYLSFLFGFSALFLGWRNYILQEGREVLKVENAQLQVENSHLKELKHHQNISEKNAVEKKENIKQK